METNAFVLRMNIGEKDLVQSGDAKEEIIIGWSNAEGLLDENLNSWQFREIIHQTYAAPGDNYRASGGWAGSMWRFIREMEIGDYVVVPSGNDFYLAEVTGEPERKEEYVNDDTAHRRKVKWLNKGEPIPRRYAHAPLQSRMKARQTCVSASDLIDQIKEVLIIAEEDREPEFSQDLRQKLIDKTNEMLYLGRLNPHSFERLISNLLHSQGGKENKVVSRNKDLGADIVAFFNVAKSFKFKLAVQAKHYRPDPPVERDAIDQLLEGMSAEDADIGWVVTAGTFSKDAYNYHWELKEKGYQIELIDGEQLAALIVEEGLSATGFIEEDNELSD